MSAVSQEYAVDKANPHYLKRVVTLSGNNCVTTSEDVYDQRGFKVLSRGAIVDESVYERLLRYKLNKPIESMLGVEDGVTVAELAELAEELLEANIGLARTLSLINADSMAIALVKRLRLEGASRLMLSLHRQENVRLRHGMMVALLAVGIGYRAGLPEAQLSALVVAGVLHDVGELYIDPGILNKTQMLSPSEWRHIASHPLIGELVVRETMSFPRETSRIVAEHHERINGYGYPRLLSGNMISPAGVCLATAEVVAGIIGREGNDFFRIGSALKLIPGEFPKMTVSLIEQTFRAMRDELGIPKELLVGASLGSRVDQLATVLATSVDWVQEQSAESDNANRILRFVRDRLSHLQRAAFSVGMFGDAATVASGGELSDIEMLELQSVCQEIRFRLKELSYLTSLHPGNDGETEKLVGELAARLLASDVVASAVH